MMNKFKLYCAVILTTTMLFSCDSGNESPASPTDVIVINEGNYSNADGSLTGYNSSSKTVAPQLFENANGFSITATIQNVVTYDNKYFIIGNSPDKVEVVNKGNMRSVATLSGDNQNLANPFMFAARGDKGYISNWGTLNSTDFTYENPFITVVDLADFSVLKKINLNSQPQGLIIYGDNLYIGNADSGAITIMDTMTDEITGSMTTPFGPDRFVLDKNDKIWAICRGGALVRFDPAVNEVEQIIENVVTSGFNEKMVINIPRDKLYYLATVYAPDFSSSTTSVFEFSIADSSAPAAPIISGSSFYGIGIDKDNTLFVGDHNGFQGTGTVYLYGLNGNKISEFESGIAPNGFIFK